MPLVLITLIVPRISGGAHKVCSVEGLYMKPKVESTHFIKLRKYISMLTIAQYLRYAKKVTLHKSKNRSIWLIYMD